MPVFSFTAPIVTAEQEQLERDSLGPDERFQLKYDLYGDSERYVASAESISSSSPSPEHDYDVSESCCSGSLSSLEQQTLTEETMIKLVQEAMELSVSDLEKKEYLNAMERIPDLVQKESNPVAYYRCEGDALAAAKRLANYWKLRTKVFGPSLWFLPMTQPGALRESVDALERGFVWMLPNDRMGRNVIFFDRTRAIPSVVSRDQVMRVLFYILQKASNPTTPGMNLSIDTHNHHHHHDHHHGPMTSGSPPSLFPTTITTSSSVPPHSSPNITSSATKQDTPPAGFVYLRNLQGYDLYTHFDRLLVKTETSLLKCFPSKLKAFHTCAGSGKWVVEMVLPVIKQIAGKYIRLHSVCHTGSNADILAELQCYNLRPTHLPYALGGAITQQHYQGWLEKQFMREVEEEEEEELREMGIDLDNGIF